MHRISISVLNVVGLIFLMSSSNAFGQCDRKTDSLELVKIYNSTVGYNWSSPWPLYKPINQWQGVHLNIDGCVDSLELIVQNLGGPLPDLSFPELKYFEVTHNEHEGPVPQLECPKLKYLELELCSLVGKIPDYQNLKELEFLSLLDNHIEGPIPDFNMPKLEHLLLGRNNIASSIPPFSKLSKLKYLNLNINQFSGELPHFSLPELEVLFLGGNELTGGLINLEGLPNLRKLYAGGNYFSGEIPDFKNLDSLEILDLADNCLTGNMPALAGLKKLTFINVSGNQLSGSIPNFNLPEITALEMNNNYFSGQLPHFSFLKKVSNLDVSTNLLSGSIPSFDENKALMFLDLSNNILSGEIPVLDLPSLNFLYLNGNRFSDSLPNLNSLPVLSRLRIQDNQFTFTDLYKAKKINKFLYSPQLSFYHDTTFYWKKNELGIIDLNIDSSIDSNQYQWIKNDIPWSVPPGNSKHSNMLIFQNLNHDDYGRYYSIVTNPEFPDANLMSKEISVRVCDVEQDSLQLVKLYQATSGDSWFNRLNWLQSGTSISDWYGVTTDKFGCVRSLQLNGNNLTGNLPDLEMNTLDSLDVSSNNLQGNLAHFNIDFIKLLNLRSNYLTGNLPVEIKNWKELEHLDLGDNQFTGELPEYIGNLHDLKTLRLDHNSFFGKIPGSISNLEHLRIGQVNLSFNQFDTLNQSMVLFCPLGVKILENTPVDNQFIQICSARCNGLDWEDMLKASWLKDTLAALLCANPDHIVRRFRSNAGFVEFTGLKLVYTKTSYYDVSKNTYRNIETNFYDCAGNLIEQTVEEGNSYNSRFGNLSDEMYRQLNYDEEWFCCNSIPIPTDNEETVPEKNKTVHSVTQLNCFPNPVGDYLKCSVDALVTQIKLINLQGRIFAELDRDRIQDNQVVVDFQQVPSGIYFIVINSSSDRNCFKVIKP
ncbi:MAG: T9SS type A sorting domain-containing protein [Saprospiraceae bacterium]|nr:T9SS type A sorting domain-containing protein [Saprospiraceae bacterium]